MDVDLNLIYVSLGLKQRQEDDLETNLPCIQAIVSIS